MQEIHARINDDQEGARTVDDDNFIDDNGVDPAYRYGNDNEPHSPTDAPQAEEGEEDDEIKQLFKMVTNDSSWKWIVANRHRCSSSQQQ
ncbi:protein IWS [Salix suchowensis]|nr:protein IWS [Salix suchowensis]